MGIVVGAVESATDSEIGVPTVVLGVVLALVAVGAYANRCRNAGAVDRARRQWAGWGVVVAVLIMLVGEILNLLLEWPPSPGAVALVATVLIPVSLTLSSWDSLAVRATVCWCRRSSSRVSSRSSRWSTCSSCSVSATCPTTKRATCSGSRSWRRSSRRSWRSPARRSLDEMARRRVYGERRSPDEAIQTFGSRMSRAVPMDEILLQLAESLKLSMQLETAEVWTGNDGVLERVVSAPERADAGSSCPRRSCRSSAARVSGNAWLQVWVPSLVADRGECLVRVAPVVHSGLLLGLIVAERKAGLRAVHRRVGARAHRVRAPGWPRVAQRPTRLRVAGSLESCSSATRSSRPPGCAS